MRRCWGGLAVLATVVVVLVPASGSQGASEVQVDSLRIGPFEASGTSQTGTVLLKAGVRYHLVVTGYVSQAAKDPSLGGSVADDAFYHFEDSQHPGPPSPGGILFLGIRSEATGHVDFLRTFAEDQRGPAYVPSHRYENHFTLKQDARLVVSAGGLGDSNFTYGGPGFIVSVLSGGGSPVAPPKPVTQPNNRCKIPAAAASAHAAARAPTPLPLVCMGTIWVEQIGFTGLQPGGEAIASSPPLGNTTKAKLTVNGLTDDDLAVFGRAVTTERLHRGTFKAACLLAFRNGVHPHVNAVYTLQVVFVTHYLFELARCLDVAKVIDAVATSNHGANTAQVPGCGLTPFVVTGQRLSGRPSQVRVSGGNAPTAPIHVTCLRSQGQIDLTVESRTRGAPLSRFLGPRLAIGIVRSRRDQPGGQVTARFARL